MLTFGLPGKLCFKQNVDIFCCKTLDSIILLNLIDNNKIIIPNYQREIDIKKINCIVEHYLERQKYNENIFHHSEFKLASIQIDKKWYNYLVDGQHRLQALKILIEQKNVIGDIRLTHKHCYNLDECIKYFEEININSNIEPIYKDLQEPFNRKLIYEIKKELKCNYENGFSKQKNNKKYWHLDEFLSELSIDKLKNTIYIDNNNQLNTKLLLKNIVLLNQKIKDVIDLNNFSVYTKKKLEETDIYFTLKFVNFFECLLNLEIKLNIKTENKSKKKKKIPKNIRILTWDKRFPNKRTGKCFCCGKNKIDITEFHVGHIIPESKGGSNNIDNLEPICVHCNLSMGNKNMNDFKNTYFPKKEQDSFVI